jgi:crossover junction endodeoxyribonuclease RuvC
MDMLRILGIDPGSKVTGFALLETQKSGTLQARDFVIKDAGVLRPSSTSSIFERMSSLHLAIREIYHEWRPQVCVIEKAFVGVNINSALRLGEVRGALISAVSNDRAEIVEVAARKVKKTITGNGAASKEEVLRAVQLLLNFNKGKLPYDVSDALAIALYYGLYHYHANHLGIHKVREWDGGTIS